MVENLVKYFTKGIICSSPRHNEVWHKAFFKAGAGHWLKRTWLVVPEILDPISIPLQRYFWLQAINFIQAKALGDEPLKSIWASLCTTNTADKASLIILLRVEMNEFKFDKYCYAIFSVTEV